MVTALEAGAIDLAVIPSLLDTVRLQQDARYRVLVSDVGGTRYALLFNAVGPPTDNQRLRQALLNAWIASVSSTRCCTASGRRAIFHLRSDRRRTQRPRPALHLRPRSGPSVGQCVRALSPALDFNYVSVSAEWAEIGQVYQADRPDRRQAESESHRSGGTRCQPSWPNLQWRDDRDRAARRDFTGATSGRSVPHPCLILLPHLNLTRWRSSLAHCSTKWIPGAEAQVTQSGATTSSTRRGRAPWRRARRHLR